MLRRHTDAASLGPTDHQRHRRFTPQHVAEFGDLIDDLIHGTGDEIPDLNLDHGSHAGHRRAQPAADEGGFRNRRIAGTIGPELIVQALRYPENPPDQADVFTHHEHTWIATHLLLQRFIQRFGEG